MKIPCFALLVFCLFLSSCQLAPRPVNEEKVIAIGNDLFKTECKPVAGGIYLLHEGFISLLKPQKKRCEVATDPLILPATFSLKFDFMLKSMPLNDRQWFSIFQLHSFPDKHLNERWRCPVMALEIVNSTMRMYSRWDENEKSSLRRGTCANEQNSINDRLLFEGIDIELMKPMSIELSMHASYGNDGFVKVSINGKEIASVKGATAYNDRKGVFLKYGIYKPTSWSDNTSIEVEYQDIEFYLE